MRRGRRRGRIKGENERKRAAFSDAPFTYLEDDTVAIKDQCPVLAAGGTAGKQSRRSASPWLLLLLLLLLLLPLA